MIKLKQEFYQPYQIMLSIYGFFLIFALIHDPPHQIWNGLIQILTSRSLLVTDYIELGGIGATLVNVVMVGSVSILMLIISGVKPNGATIMALWLTTGFAFFGKNLLNMFPITFGVWLYAKSQKEPFIRYYLVSLLAATISPVVSEIVFLGLWSPPVSVLAGVLTGIFCGFLFPAISSYCVRVHDGYNLYNMGFAGGLLSSFLAAIFNSLGIEINSILIWNSGNDRTLAFLLYFISLFLIICGIVLGERKRIISDMRGITRHSGRLATDFYILFGENVYINMGILCIFSTTLVLWLKADLNGPTISGILTIVGFGCFGKHLKNIIPVIAGALIGTIFNQWDMTWPSNILAILFSTGLAPIAGQYGWLWGMAAGFLHVNFVIHIKFLNNGMNLYNNGYAAGFVALLLVPVIIAFRKDRS